MFGLFNKKSSSLIRIDDAKKVRIGGRVKVAIPPNPGELAPAFKRGIVLSKDETRQILQVRFDNGEVGRLLVRYQPVYKD